MPLFPLRACLPTIVNSQGAPSSKLSNQARCLILPPFSVGS